MSTRKKIKVCCFTASANRPLPLRHCIYQLQQQTIQHHHCIYVNSNQFKSEADETNYLPFVSDIPVKKKNNIFLAYGPTDHQHYNHMAAVSLAPDSHYDLYLKIDDDDIYFNTYIEDIITSFQTHKWDISGSYSDGILNNNKIKRNIKYLTLNNTKKNPLQVMPGTLAFSHKAMALLQSTFETKLIRKHFEDEQWIEFLCQQKEIKSHIRQKSNYMYHIHEKNICKPKITT